MDTHRTASKAMAVQGESCCRPALISSCCLWWRASCTSELTGLFNKLLVLFQHFILSGMRPHENKTDMLTCISSCVIRAQCHQSDLQSMNSYVVLCFQGDVPKDQGFLPSGLPTCKQQPGMQARHPGERCRYSSKALSVLP